MLRFRQARGRRPRLTPATVRAGMRVRHVAFVAHATGVVCDPLAFARVERGLDAVAVLWDDDATKTPAFAILSHIFEETPTP